MHFLHCKTQPLEFCSDMFLLPLGFPNTVESIDLSTNAYVKYPCPIPPPPRTSTLNQGFPKDSYLNNIIDVKNPLLNTLTLKNQLDQKEQSYYEILVNRLEFNNNEYVSKVLSSDATNPENNNDTNQILNVCSSVEKIVTSSPSRNISANNLDPPIIPPPPLLSSFVSDDFSISGITRELNMLSAPPPPVPDPPKRTHTHYLEPIFESLEHEKNF